MRSISNQTAVASDAGSESTTSTARDPDLDAGKALGRRRGSRSTASNLLRHISPAGESQLHLGEKRHGFARKSRYDMDFHLPRKGQLAPVYISRLSEPLTQTSLQSYMFYQLENFDPLLRTPPI